MVGFVSNTYLKTWHGIIVPQSLVNTELESFLSRTEKHPPRQALKLKSCTDWKHFAVRLNVSNSLRIM